METLILDGAVALRDVATAAAAALEAELAARGHRVERRDLAGLDTPDCRGDFGCWTATPGVCVHPGPHREVARALIRSDLAVWVTSLSFGGHASALKRGDVVPGEAQRLARRLPIPAWLHRRLADLGFRQEARRRRTLDQLGARPDL